MKLTPNAPADIQNALRILGKNLPETDAEIDAFIANVDSGKIKIPATPSHLTPTAIAAALIQDRRPQATERTVEFPKNQTHPGIAGLQMAARNGDGPLSEETIRQMKDAQDSDEEEN